MADVASSCLTGIPFNEFSLKVRRIFSMIHPIFLILTTLCLVALTVDSVIVDGKRKGPSAWANQSREDEMIDGYNTQTCGIFDTDKKATEFVNSAKEGQFPWLVSFQVKKDDGSLAHFCMGSFISDRWILSAAHCFADP